MSRAVLPALALILALASSAARADELLVFAASSLTEVLEAVGRDAEAAGDGRVRFSFAGSATLARQIRAGAPADVVIAADRETIDALADAGAVLPDSRTPIVSNRLVVVVPADDERALAALSELAAARFERIALAEPGSVPAGRYAREALVGAGAWEALGARLVATESVRSALAAVATGSVDAGVVFATDARTEPRVRVALELPADASSPIVYVGAVVRDPRDPAAAHRFLARLISPEVAERFRRAGFALLSEATP